MPESMTGSHDSSPVYSLYILRCADGSLYTGIALDVDSRMVEHERGTRGAKYLRGRTPLKLVFHQAVGDRGEAQRVEYRVKQLSRETKLKLVSGELTLAAAGLNSAA